MTNRGPLVVGVVVIAISAVLYPVAIVPLSSRHIKEEKEAAPGFEKRVPGTAVPIMPGRMATTHNISSIAQGVARPWTSMTVQRMMSTEGASARLSHVVSDTVKAKARRMSIWVGSLAGIFGSFVGVGGGVLISPIIANACRSLPQRIISGTSLAAVVAVGSVSGLVYFQNGHVDVTSAVVIAAAAVLTSPLGARATHMVNSTRLRQMLGCWLLFVSPLVPLKVLVFSQLSTENLLGQPLTTAAHAPPGTAKPAETDRGAIKSDSDVAKPDMGITDWVGPLRPLCAADGVLASVGAIAGFASGLLGVGGGTIVTPLLALLTGLPQTSVVGTSLAAMAIPATVGLAQHARLGNVDWLMAAGLVAGSFGGSFLGSNIALNLPPMILEGAFAIGMAFLGYRTLAVVKATEAAQKAAAAVAAGVAAGAPLTAAAAAKAAAGAVKVQGQHLK